MSRFARKLQQAANKTAPIRLYLTPSQGTYNVGDTLVVTIREDSLTTPVNSVQADLTYPTAQLQYVSTSTTGSNFTTTVSNSGGGGTVQLSMGILASSLTGDQFMAQITFNVVGSGAAAVAFAAGDGIARASDATDVCQAKLGANYTVN